jgi:hypothetical protein
VILHHLGMIFVPLVAASSALSIAVLMYYDIDRSKHQRNIEMPEGGDELLPTPVAKVSR